MSIGEIGFLSASLEDRDEWFEVKVFRVIDQSKCLMTYDDADIRSAHFLAICDTADLTDGAIFDCGEMVAYVQDKISHAISEEEEKTIWVVNFMEIEPLLEKYAQYTVSQEFSGEKTRKSLEKELRSLKASLEKLRSGRIARYLKLLERREMFSRARGTEGGAKAYDENEKEIQSLGEVSEDEISQYRGEAVELERAIREAEKILG